VLLLTSHPPTTIRQFYPLGLGTTVEVGLNAPSDWAILFSMPTLYETLGVPQSAGPEQIKRSYRTLVKRFHPDLFPSGSDAQINAGERLGQIIAAYRVLSNPQKRLAYDTKCATRPRHSSLDPHPEHCDKCGRPTLYWQIGREAARCDHCGGTLR
jgi:DnaJ-like protein